ncbi:hypothetical protein G4G28_14040 [Massilia sp. Dwa41.01b]|nr:hypothetical protein [Massilia sp. Dwa41.01b]QNA89308.1 hypothetical protein G4G28_14040 [Massilia sp. Dwa41.01b]
MNPTDMRALRAQYAYPPGCLKPTTREDVKVHVLGNRRLHVEVPGTAEWARPEVRARHSSVALDRFHTGLLLSDDVEDRLHGLLSCVTWGFVSGTDLLIKPERAFGRAGSLLKGAGSRRPPRTRPKSGPCSRPRAGQRGMATWPRRRWPACASSSSARPLRRNSSWQCVRTSLPCSTR